MRTRISFILLTALLLSCGASKAPPIARDYPLTRITEHVYVIRGPDETPGKDNQGFCNNPGFVLTPGGVVVIDPGASVQVGEMVLRKIASVTRAPVIAVFDTHLQEGHWLGNQAIKAAFPRAVIYAPSKMIEALKAGEGDKWVRQLDETTQGATRGTTVIAPDMGLDNGDVLRLHGMSFHVYGNARALHDTGIMIEVPEEDTIFLGDEVLNRRVAANLAEPGVIQDRIAAADMALESKARHFIPGQGSSGGREIAQAQRAFLVTLRAAVKKYRARGLGDVDLRKKVLDDLSAYRAWAGFGGLERVIDAVSYQVE